MAPPIESFNIITAAITIWLDLTLATLLIIAGVFAFRGLGPTYTDDYRKKYGGYDRRIASGVLFLVSWYVVCVSILGKVANRLQHHPAHPAPHGCGQDAPRVSSGAQRQEEESRAEPRGLICTIHCTQIADALQLTFTTLITFTT